jgi:hypothetical protein
MLLFGFFTGVTSSCVIIVLHFPADLISSQPFTLMFPSLMMRMFKATNLGLSTFAITDDTDEDYSSPLATDSTVIL